jgi:putative transposase
MRKQYSATFKAEAVKELLKEEKTINQLAAALGVHPSQLKDWKKIALQGLPELFSREGKASEQAKVHEQQVNDLYGEIGRLTTQVNWLKKKSGRGALWAPESK